MFRAIFELLLTAIVVLFLRAVIGIVMKGFRQTMQPQPQPQGGPRPANHVPLSGELKKDPVCGTYIATNTSIKETMGGQTFYFCSQECRNKYVASLAR
jgi:YHS domain-containing protein